MTDFNENENVERIRQKEQPVQADRIKRAMNIGFHLKCLRCGAAYYHTEFAMSEMSYRMYSYCPDCIDKGIEALKKEDKSDGTLIDKLSTFLAKNYEPMYKLESVGKLKWPIDYEQHKEAWKVILEGMVNSDG